jgi:flagellar assembly protein FliH
MSLSARRLPSAVLTDRFAWQQTGGPKPEAEAFFSRVNTTRHEPVAEALADLPSPSAERIAAIEREAFDRGYADGERAGEAAAAVRADAALARLTGTIEDIAALRGSIMRRSERDMVRLAVAMAERVLRREVDLDRELLVIMARTAIERLGSQTSATIHLNPIDHDVVLSKRQHDFGSAVELIADPSVARGACQVRSAFGTIDAGIEAQIGELSRALLGDGVARAEESDDPAVRF